MGAHDDREVDECSWFWGRSESWAQVCLYGLRNGWILFTTAKIQARNDVFIMVWLY